MLRKSLKIRDNLKMSAGTRNAIRNYEVCLVNGSSLDLETKIKYSCQVSKIFNGAGKKQNMSEQERLALLASEDLLSICEAAKLTPYSADYLSLLARQGRLPATKIARNWLTTRKAVLSYLQYQQQKHQTMATQLARAQKGVI